MFVTEDICLFLGGKNILYISKKEVNEKHPKNPFGNNEMKRCRHLRRQNFD